MTKFCESCHTPNRDHAKYCRGCAGRFSGIVTGATAVRAFASPPIAGKPAAGAGRGDDAVADTRGSGLVRWAMALALSLCAFVLWHWGQPKVDGDAPWRRTTLLPGPPATAPVKTAATPSKDPAPVATASQIDIVQRALALKPATASALAPTATPGVDPQAEDHLVQDIPPPRTRNSRSAPAR